MNRKQTKINSMFDEELKTMESRGEADSQMRVFPHPLPDGYRIMYKWSFPRAGHPGELRTWCEPDPNYVPPKAPADAPAAEQGDEGEPTLPDTDRQPPTLADTGNAPGYTRESLEGKKQAELMTIGAELGLELKVSQSKAVMAGLILEAQAKKQ